MSVSDLPASSAGPAAQAAAAVSSPPGPDLAPRAARPGENAVLAAPSSTRGRRRLLRFCLLRFGRLLLVLFGVLTLLFLVLRVSGNPAAVIAGPQASQSTIAAISKSLGLDRPLPVQYAEFLSQAVRLNFGTSYETKTPAMPLVLSHLPASLGLIGLAMLLAIVVALPLGVAGALSRSRLLQRLLDGLVLLGQAVPIFWLAIVLVWFLSVKNHLLPSLAPNGFSSGISAWVQPVVVLALYPLARVLQLARSGLLESMSEDFTRTATAKGVSRTRVVVRHGMRPVLTSLVTVVGVDLSQMLSGAVLIEVIYSWPGIGQLLVNSVSGRDYPVVEAITMIVAVLVVAIGFVVDLAYGWIDPRVGVA